MIFPSQRKQLNKILGTRYSAEVQQLLKESNIKSRNGKPYGASMIRNVFNGLNENEAIEAALWKLAVRKAKRIAQNDQHKEQLLKLLAKVVVKKSIE